MQVQIGSTISFFMQFLQINFKASGKDEGEDLHCNWQVENVSEDLIRYDKRRKQKAGSKMKRFC